MALPDITGLTASSTFSELFLKNNEMITRLNLLDVSSIAGGTGITVTEGGSNGGVTLSVSFDYSTVPNVSITITGTLPSGITLGDAIASDTGVTGYTSGTNTSTTTANKFVGFVTVVTPTTYEITTTGFIGLTGSLSNKIQNTLYYLSTLGGVTTNAPTSSGSAVKPVLLVQGPTGDLQGLILHHSASSVVTDSYAKSSSRTIANLTVSGISAGNVIYYDIASAGWTRSIANDYKKAEVFGIVESLTDSVATVVIHGSIDLPAGFTYSVGDGGSGGDDIWFLSGTTAGAMQNQGPTASGHIVKPIYYSSPHTYSGVTFTGIVVNYIGYKNS